MAWFQTQSDPKGMKMAVELPVAFIEEEGSVVAYTPALDLSTCGKDKNEANKMFREAVQIFFNDLVENGTVDEVLTSLNWKKDAAQETWIPPRISQESVGVKIPALA
jgi:predicted RNase H-like HicB family nuclease